MTKTERSLWSVDRAKHDRAAGPNTPTTRSFGLREPGTIVCRC